MAELPVFLGNNKIFDANTMTSTLTSATQDIAEAGGYCSHSIFTGTPTGTLTVEASNDGVNFSIVHTLALTGSAGQDLYNADKPHYRYVRVKYTFSSGTGSLTTYFSSKRI